MQARKDLLPKKPFEGKYADLSEKIIKIFYQMNLVTALARRYIKKSLELLFEKVV